MEKISCEIISDLLPLYCDGICTQASRTLVENHLKDCAECSRMLEKMHAECQIARRQEQKKETVLKNLSAAWKRSLWKSFLKGLLAASCTVLLVFSSFWGLTRWPAVIVPPDDVAASASVTASDFTVQMRITKGYKSTTTGLTASDDGKLYIYFKRGIIPVRDGNGTSIGGTYSASLTQKSESGKTVQIKEIYYGTKEACRLLWKDAG